MAAKMQKRRVGTTHQNKINEVFTRILFYRNVVKIPVWQAGPKIFYQLASIFTIFNQSLLNFSLAFTALSSGV